MTEFERLAQDPDARWCNTCKEVAISSYNHRTYACLFCDGPTVSLHELWHGKPSGYMHHRCRCPRCRGWRHDDYIAKKRAA